jgi:hypothetical protein
MFAETVFLKSRLSNFTCGLQTTQEYKKRKTDMQKVTYKYSFYDAYRNVHYKQKTVLMGLPKDEYGFILMTDLCNKIERGLSKGETLIWVRIH